MSETTTIEIKRGDFVKFIGKQSPDAQPIPDTPGLVTILYAGNPPSALVNWGQGSDWQINLDRLERVEPDDSRREGFDPEALFKDMPPVLVALAPAQDALATVQAERIAELEAENDALRAALKDIDERALAMLEPPKVSPGLHFRWSAIAMRRAIDEVLGKAK